MAVSGNTKNSFAVIGTPQAVLGFDPLTVDSTAQRPIGFKAEDAQGNVYRYSHFGAAAGPGLVVSQDVSESSVVDTDNVIVAPASAQTTSDGTLGSKYIEITLASVSEDDYAGGKITITGGSGAGYTYGIVGNTATGDPASGNIRLTLDGKIKSPVDASSDFAIAGPLYGNLEAASTTDFAIAGVTMARATAGDYGWILTKGNVGILQDGVTVVGKGIKVGAVAGSVNEATATNDNVFGYCVVAGDDAGYCVAKINCE